MNESKRDGRRVRRLPALAFVVGVLCILPAIAMAGGGPAGSEGADVVRWDLAVAIAASVGLSSLAAGYAVAKVGAAALGAASEKPELLTRSLVFVALGEGLAVFGFLIGLLLVLKL